MKLIILIVAIAIFLAVLSLLGSKKSSTNKRRANNLSVKKAGNGLVEASSPYRATSISCGANACSSAREIGGKRFLDVEQSVPILPLSGCDAESCKCTYKHHDDRRSEDEERRHVNSLRADLYTHSGNDDRRQSKRGRRKSDLS